MAVDSRVVTVASGGGAKHRSMEPPTEPHNVPTPHAVAEVHTVADLTLLTPRPLQFGRTV